MRFLAFLAAAILACGSSALAWGTKGHRIINHLAAQGFSAHMPAFLTTGAAAYEVAFLGPELDDLKGSGEAWDSEYDPGPF